MLKFIIKKLLQMIPMLLVISLLVFIGLELTGIDPLSYMVSPDMAGSAENLERLREQMGLNDPLFTRYFRWVSEMLRGDFGYSIVSGTPISQIIAVRIPATIELALLALVFSTIIGVGIGIVSAIKQNGIIDYVGRVFAVVGQSIPQFFFGIILIQIFAVSMGWFPVGQRISPGGNWSRIQHLVLPVTTLTLSMCAVLMRYARNTMLDVMNSDYIKTARSKGIPEWKVIIKHGFRNAMRPVLVIICFRLPMLIGGSVVIESVFSWPGIGTIIASSVIAGDMPVIMVTTLMVAASILVASFLVDVFTALLDPRVRLGD
ncbi:MAG: ABC transporter permease [Christensenellaceae bacterium]|nr:ABC transporter permease [Christensenellaceae bacterium]